jgi:hypothetical protein
LTSSALLLLGHLHLLFSNSPLTTTIISSLTTMYKTPPPTILFLTTISFIPIEKREAQDKFSEIFETLPVGLLEPYGCAQREHHGLFSST